MATRVQSQAEPIPGYKLLERIGGGGFGEVWKAEAPGGILKAIKFVHGTIHGAHGEDSLMQQELKSLNRVKTVRHPYILSLERYDIIDGQLMIVMELADRNLWDRFTECKGQGLNGLPRQELIGYMDETAEALDLMNIQYQLQHLDIKPQNLFLVHNHVKVADFGLVKDLEGMNTQVTSGVTPVYAAPETFDGIVSRYCDQYNLAIVYQELLTGQRPFNGTNVRQLLMQHLTGTPDLSSLPICDREVIARALSKKPEDRWPTCTDMVKALNLAGQAAGAGSEPTRQELMASIETPAVIRVSPTARSDRPATPPPVVAPAPPPLSDPQPMPTIMPPPALHQTQPPLNQTQMRPAFQPPPVAERKAPPVPERQEVTGNGVLFPALVIGIGNVGLHVLRALRRSLSERQGPPELLPQLRLLYIDSDPNAMAEATDGPADAALGENEVVLAKLNKPAHYLKPVRNRAALDSWLNLAMICRVPRNQVTTEGLRLLGRLALADNYRAVAGHMKADLEALTNPKALTSADRQTRLGLRTNRPRVYVISSLGGGTGGGMFVDIGYIARSMLQRMGFEKPETVGVFLLPPAERSARKSPAMGNTFASLTELFHFSAPETTYQAFFDDQEDPLTDKGAPFNRSFVLPLPEEGADQGPLHDLANTIGDFLCRDCLTPVGRKTDELRDEVLANPDDPGGMAVQTFGAYRFATPRGVLRENVSRALVRRLVQNWLGHDRATMQKTARSRVAEQWEKLQLDPESLIANLRTACERSLDEAPETTFDKVLHRCFGKGGEVQPADALAALGQLEQLVGRPSSDLSATRTPLTEALEQAAHGLRRDCEQKLADLISGMVEEPRLRVFGAEESGQHIMGMLGDVMRGHINLYQELAAKAADAHTHIHALLCNLQKGSWWPGRKSKTGVELRESMELFPRTRYQALILQHLLDLYQALTDGFPKRIEEIGFCRQRLVEFQKRLEDRPGASRVRIDLGPGRHFLPNQSHDAEEAIETLLKAVKPDELIDLDQKVQSAVRRQFKSLLQVCIGTGDIFQELQSLMQAQAETFADGLLGKTSVAAVYLKELGDEAEIKADLARTFDEAAPALVGTRYGGSEVRLVAVPADLAGERLGKIARAAARDVEVSASGGDDVYFYRECPQFLLAELPQLGLMAEEAYRQMSGAGHFTPHTRTDIVDWLQAT